MQKPFIYTFLYGTQKISFFNHLQNIIKIKLNIAIGDKLISLVVVKWGFLIMRSAIEHGKHEFQKENIERSVENCSVSGL